MRARAGCLCVCAREHCYKIAFCMKEVRARGCGKVVCERIVVRQLCVCVCGSVAQKLRVTSACVRE